MVKTRGAQARETGAEDKTRKSYVAMEEGEDIEEGQEEFMVEAEQEEGEEEEHGGPKKKKGGPKKRGRPAGAGAKKSKPAALRREDESNGSESPEVQEKVGAEGGGEAAQEPEAGAEEQAAAEKEEEEPVAKKARGEAEEEAEEEAGEEGMEDIVPERPSEAIQEEAAPEEEGAVAGEGAVQEEEVGEGALAGGGEGEAEGVAEEGGVQEAVPETQEPEQEQAVAETQEPEVQQEQEAEPAQEEAPPAVEQGRISFFYRPKVGLEEAGSIEDVQRFYMILAPADGGKARLAVVGKKRLPSVEKHERFFGFIEAVADSVDTLTQELGPKEYETKTRGTRTVAAARAVGEGAYAYAIVNRGGTGAGAGRTHLVIKTEVPATPGEVQEEFQLPSEGSFVFSVKNPGNEPPKGPTIGLQEKAEYSEEKKKEFTGYSWIGVTDPELLNYEKCEFLLVAASEDPSSELGASAGDLAGGSAERYCADADEECLLEELKKETNAEEVGIEMAPIETGEWK